MRIALAVAVLFGVVYMVALKPKNETAAPAATPVATQAPASASASDANKANTGLGKAVEAAHGAADATEKSQAAQAGEAVAPATSAPSTTQSTPSTSSSSSKAPSTAAETEPATDSALADLPAWLQKSMDHKVVAILFTNNKSADDRRTGKALKHAYTAHGKVVTHSVPVSQISKYRPVAEGVDVSQSPTLMVIDRTRSAQTLVGYSSLNAINQAIIDGLLATDNPVEHVKYLQAVQHECRQITDQAIIGKTGGSSINAARRNVDALIATMSSSLGTLRNTPVPAAYRPLSKQVNHYIASEVAAGREIRSSAFGKRFVDAVKVRQVTRGNDRLEHRVKLNLNAVGVDACN
jgi:hypothetical protein